MADNKPTAPFYKNLGGVNLKASSYEMNTAQFLNLRNVDFDVPNALQKRPGQTGYITPANGTSGPILAVHEYVQLSGGGSFLVAASDTGLFEFTNNKFTLIAGGWTNNVNAPPDMTTFNDRLYVANGQHWNWYLADKTQQVPPSFNPAGLPCPATSVTCPILSYQSSGASIWGVFGSFTALAGLSAGAGSGYQGVAVFTAYSYLRGDGYQGPLDFEAYSTNLGYGSSAFQPATTGLNTATLVISGFSCPSGQDITAIAIWIGVFPFTQGNYNALFGLSAGGANNIYGLIRPAPPEGLDLTQFFLYGYAPTNTQTYIIAFPAINGYSLANMSANGAFSGMPFCWFNTNTPRYIEIHQNQMFASGFSNSPSTVWGSDVGEPEFFEPQNNFEVRTNDGDRVFAKKSFNDQLVIMKQYSFWKLIGDSFANYQLVNLSYDYGCISKWSILTYNQKMLWLDRKGILEYNGASWEIISGPVEPIFRRMNLSAAYDKAVGVHHIYRNQLWWGIPIDGSTQNNITVVYDYLVGAWTFFDGFNPASFGFIKGPLSKQTVFKGDYSGTIGYFGESFYGDNGNAFTCLFFTHFDQMGTENQTWIWRRLFLDTSVASGATGALTGEIFSNYDQSTIQATFTMYQNVFQTRAEIGVIGKAVAAQISHCSASLPLLINGYAWGARNLRNV